MGPRGLVAGIFFSTLARVISHDIAIVILSVRPSVSHIGDPHQNRSVYRLCGAPHDTVMFLVFEANFGSPQFKGSKTKRKKKKAKPNYIATIICKRPKYTATDLLTQKSETCKLNE